MDGNDIDDAADIQYIEDLMAAELMIIHESTYFALTPIQRAVIPHLTLDGLDDSDFGFTRFQSKVQLHRLLAALRIPEYVLITPNWLLKCLSVSF
jgi:hypothetical protein